MKPGMRKMLMTHHLPLLIRGEKQPGRLSIKLTVLPRQATVMMGHVCHSLDRALPDLRSKDERRGNTQLRRIHVKLWHAPAQRMRDLLSAAGVAEDVVNK
eukprot:886162-Karenia_brevis.AAC.1